MEDDDLSILAPVYPSAKPAVPGLPERPTETSRVRRDLHVSPVTRAIRRCMLWLAGAEQDPESKKYARYAQMQYWFKTHLRSLAMGLLAAVVVVIAVSVAWFGRDLLRNDTEVLTLPDGTVLYHVLKREMMNLPGVADPVLGYLARSVLNSSAIDRDALRRGWFEADWRGGRVNVTIDRFDAAMRAAPAHKCVTATRFGLPGHAVRPPHHDQVLYMPAGRPGASASIEIRAWPTDDALDPYIRDRPAQIYSPREQFFGYYNRDGVACEERFSGATVACIRYAEDVLMRVGLGAM